MSNLYVKEQMKKKLDGRAYPKNYVNGHSEGKVYILALRRKRKSWTKNYDAYH